MGEVKKLIKENIKEIRDYARVERIPYYLIRERAEEESKHYVEELTIIKCKELLRFGYIICDIPNRVIKELESLKNFLNVNDISRIIEGEVTEESKEVLDSLLYGSMYSDNEYNYRIDNIINVNNTSVQLLTIKTRNRHSGATSLKTFTNDTNTKTKRIY